MVVNTTTLQGSPQSPGVLQPSCFLASVAMRWVQKLLHQIVHSHSQHVFLQPQSWDLCTIPKALNEPPCSFKEKYSKTMYLCVFFKKHTLDRLCTWTCSFKFTFVKLDMVEIRLEGLYCLGSRAMKTTFEQLPWILASLLRFGKSRCWWWLSVMVLNVRSQLCCLQGEILFIALLYSLFLTAYSYFLSRDRRSGGFPHFYQGKPWVFYFLLKPCFKIISFDSQGF